MNEPVLTVVINAFNEEKHIVDCIESARGLTDSIIVIDTESTDATATLAKDAGANVYSFPYPRIVEPSRSFGIHKASGDWVFVLDADERITKALSAEIKMAIKNADTDGITHYLIPRKNMFARRIWLKHGKWWPDYIPRLIKKEAFKEWPAHIHSTPVITGSKGTLREPLIHFSQGDLDDMVRKTILFENAESDLLAQAKKPASVPIFFRKYLAELYRRFLKQSGYLDGTMGIIGSFYQAYSKTITYLLVYEKTHVKKGSHH
ncbi:MAG: Glycosyl transferase family 2 [Microgenomates bacterium OLB22]|nr:MAG: Glycosyl transferase family 2 [Microgenomates bacterium OLB22]